MTTVIVAAGLLLIVLPGLPLPLPDLRPSERARASVASIRLGLVALRLGLVLGAAPTLLRAVGVEDLASRCHEVFGPIAPGGAVAGWASAAGAVAMTVRTSIARRQVALVHQAAHVEPWLGAHRGLAGADIVVLPTDETVAYAVDGAPPQIVVTEGLRDALSEAELAAVVRHERSHLVHHHGHSLTWLAITEAVAVWMPGVRRATAAVRLSIERWADEDAAAVPDDRAVLREALVKTTSRMVGPVPAFTAACTVVPRIEALDRPAPRGLGARRYLLLAPVASLTVGIAVLVVVWTSVVHHGILGYCTT